MKWLVLDGFGEARDDATDRKVALVLRTGQAYGGQQVLLRGLALVLGGIRSHRWPQVFLVPCGLKT